LLLSEFSVLAFLVAVIEQLTTGNRGKYCLLWV